MILFKIYFLIIYSQNIMLMLKMIHKKKIESNYES